MANAVRKALADSSARVANEKAERDKAKQAARLNVNVSLGFTTAQYENLRLTANRQKKSISEIIRIACDLYC